MNKYDIKVKVLNKVAGVDLIMGNVFNWGRGTMSILWFQFHDEWVDDLDLLQYWKGKVRQLPIVYFHFHNVRCWLHVQSNLSQRPPFNRDHLSIKTTTISSRTISLYIVPANKAHLRTKTKDRHFTFPNVHWYLTKTTSIITINDFATFNKKNGHHDAVIVTW